MTVSFVMRIDYLSITKTTYNFVVNTIEFAFNETEIDTVILRFSNTTRLCKTLINVVGIESIFVCKVLMI